MGIRYNSWRKKLMNLDEVPLIQKNAQISDLFLKKENYEVLLAFVLDPRLYAVSEEVTNIFFHMIQLNSGEKCIKNPLSYIWKEKTMKRLLCP